MIEPTLLSNSVKPAEFLGQALRATTTADVEALLAQLPITAEDQYAFNEEQPESGWQEGRLHWLPVGKERGNAGRIKLANQPVNPIAERTVNGMEAIIELARQREMLADASAAPPISPRDAVHRYFGLPPLDQLPKLDDSAQSKAVRANARELARQLRVRLLWDKSDREFTIAVEDDGIGQPPTLVHRTLLSLGSTTKADKPYLIGVFGQGGSSAYAVSKYSWVVSRRASDVLQGTDDGVGWTIVKHVFPKGRRDDYFAYLACHPDGRVPCVSAADADAANVTNGTRFVHIAYDFGRGGSAITRQLYTALNHVLYNPILPFELYAQRQTPDPIYGNGYRLSSLKNRRISKGSEQRDAMVLDKVFPPQPVGK
ncbi:MAG: hypothetical protein IPM13_00975 [Phycisphaerales bacterium]|nr:hypothetical protein [Phycisphaerales bacterium]